MNASQTPPEAAPFVIPTDVPFETLKGAQLEECLYWLVDDLGAKNLEWRAGGSGEGAPDGGRDLEADFFIPTADGEMRCEKWWIEAKGRKGTLEIGAVQKAALNAVTRRNVDVLLVATNTRFSNATRDWAKQWQAENPRPRLMFWDRHTLEKQLSMHPSVVVRLFATALTAQGKLEVLKQRFWNYATLASDGLLEELWKSRDDLEFDAHELLAIVISEVSNGDVAHHPWLGIVEPAELTLLLSNGILNIPFLCLRAERVGGKQEPFIAGMAYVMLATLALQGADHVEAAVRIAFPDDGKAEDVRTALASLIVHYLHDQLRDVCVSDCLRVSREATLLSQAEIETYWERLASNVGESADKGVLLMERYNAPCKVGFALDSEHLCPLVHERDASEWRATLDALKTVVDQRNAQRSLR